MSGISHRKINSRSSSRFKTETRQPSFLRSSIRCLRYLSTSCKTQRLSLQHRDLKNYSQDRYAATWSKTKRPSSVLHWKSTKRMRIKLWMTRGLRVSRILVAAQWLPRVYQAGWSAGLSQIVVWIATIIVVMRALEVEVLTLYGAGKWRVKVQLKTAPSSAIAHLTITTTIRRLLTPMWQGRGPKRLGA